MFDQVIAQLAGDGVEQLSRAAVGDRMAAGRRLQAALTAWMGRLSCHADGLGDGGLDGAGMLRVEARMSSTAATAASRTATVLEELPSAAASLAAGRITAEHARTLVHAAEKVATGKVDAELVAVAEAAPADLFARRAREWVGRNQDPESVADDHDRARRQRNGSLRVRRDGVRVLHVEFDPVTGREVESHLADACDTAWRKEG
ncbi:MAG: hypothetical protein GWN79_23105, partial [Actinobacteria bacterium]|nr:hypothetical protein [Actinomycetota bacterium]NIS35456.1 hypothetical protein [Actinomycetota bacterium]NIT98137.1 hypothetical protein [Actinomycetota bacterium]NIU21769.1 hypothetical protein [Actinomycetota bacterium]NIU70127.1 hypothetical protein [Actinomycetota bacterium]